jgi:DNA ligase 1
MTDLHDLVTDLSPKFNGVRAYWDGQTLWSRGGIAAKLPATWTLPPVALDCELYDGLDGLYRCGSAIRYGHFTPTMRLIAFDAPQAPGGYLERMAAVREAIAGSSVAMAADVTRCESTDQAVDLMRTIQGRGGEGLMVAAPELTYAPGRTNRLLKIKHAD